VEQRSDTTEVVLRTDIECAKYERCTWVVRVHGKDPLSPAPAWVIARGPASEDNDDKDETP